MEKVKGIVRHIVGGLGAFLVGMGYATPEETAGLTESLMQIFGSLAFIGGTGASVWDKIKNTPIGEQE